MTDITVYSTETFLIQYTISIGNGLPEDHLSAGEAWLPGNYSDADYHIDPATLLPIPLYEYDVVIEPNRISNIPPHTTAIVDGIMYRMGEETEIVFDLPLPQTFQVTLWNPHYRAPPQEMFSVEVIP